jgi:hypothetical protein
MSGSADWALAYARQAAADFRAWELYEQHPEAVAAECHKLLFLQMACEKLCKAHLIRTGAEPEDVRRKHGSIGKHLRTIIREQIIHTGQDPRKVRGLLTLVGHLAEEIEVLNPAMKRGERRPDNCEHPWEAGDRVISPLDWPFHPLRLVTARGGPTFIKLLKGSIERIIKELEN